MSAGAAPTGIERLSGPPARQVTLVVDPDRCCGVHRELAARLARELGVRVDVAPGKATTPVPASVGLLISLEGMLHRDTGTRLGDRLDFDRLALPPHAAAETPDLLVDFCGDSRIEGRRTLRVLYDGVAGETAMFATLLAGRVPVVELADARTGAIVSRAAPATDNAETLRGALECVLARVVTLVVGVARGWVLVGEERPRDGSARLRDIVASEIRSLAHTAARRLYHLCCHAPHWRVCWRLTDGGGVWRTHTLAGAPWTIVPDPGVRFYADPFPFAYRGRTCIFVEDFDHRTQKGIISMLPFDAQGALGPARPVLEEPWHLSYPFMFEDAGEVWMIPESSADRSVRLYRADPFPDRWIPEAVLLSDIEASDATIIRHEGRLWMFAATRDGAGSWSDTLSLFFASDIRGPWTPHPGNPILIDRRTARPAGAMIERDGRIWRPVQDCTFGYGTGIGLVEVLRLQPDAYAQRLDTVLHADASWPGRRFHTLNQAGGIECIDGAAHAPRMRLMAKRFEGWSGRREIDASVR